MHVIILFSTLQRSGGESDCQVVMGSRENPLILMSPYEFDKERVPQVPCMICCQLFWCGGFKGLRCLLQWCVGGWEGWWWLSVIGHFGSRGVEVMVDHQGLVV